MTPPESQKQVTASSGEFLGFVSYQCDRITIKSSTARNGEKRLKPTRTLVRYLSEVAPRLFFVTPRRSHENVAAVAQRSADNDEDDDDSVVSLDFSTFYLGGPLLCAVLRALIFFEPADVKSAGDGGSHAAYDVVLRVRRLDLSQNGVDNAVVNSLCELLRSGRCQYLRRVSLDRNEYVALEASQIILRTLGWHGPLGDGIGGQSHHMIALQVARRGAEVDDPSHHDVMSCGADGGMATKKETAVQLQLSATATEFQLRGMTMRDALPRLEHISFVGTNAPPHFVRRVAALLQAE